MKKLSIVLALIMALSCFCFTAFAAEGDACDYTALDKAILDATLKDTTKYTTDSVKTFTSAFDAAKEVKNLALKVDGSGENQKKIDEATKALNDAIKGLEEKDTTTTTTKPATTKAEPVEVNVDIIWKDLDGKEIRTYGISLEGYTVGSTIKAETILKTVKARVDGDGNKLIDTEKYVVSPVVILQDLPNAQGVVDGGSEIESVTFGKGRSYDFVVYVFEINAIENLAQVAATEVAGHVDWKGIASANTALINQVINGAKAAADSLAKADYPEIGEKKTEEAAKKAEGAVKGEKVVRTPDTGASAVAGVAVVVLALSATTAVVLRKKED